MTVVCNSVSKVSEFISEFSLANLGSQVLNDFFDNIFKNGANVVEALEKNNCIC